MHDIDGMLNRISGQSNYMESLSKIIGNILFVDLPTYKDRIDCIHNDCINVIRTLEELEEEEVKEDFSRECEKLDIKENAMSFYAKKAGKKTKKKREPVKRITQGYTPKELVTSSWFEKVKLLSKEGNELLEKLMYASDKDIHENWNKADEILKSSPNQRDVLKFFNTRVEDKRVFLNVVLCTRNVDDIINRLLLPFYDYEGTIRKNWDKIGNIFKMDNTITPDAIMDILSKFVIAKYRVEITGSNKYYIQLFGDMINTEDGEFDGSKFIRIVDSIDLSKLDSSSGAIRFVTLAKPIMRKLADKDNTQTLEDIVQEIQEAITCTGEERSEVEDENKDIF